LYISNQTQNTKLQALTYNSINDEAKRDREAVWLRQVITKPGVCVIFEHHSEAMYTMIRQNLKKNLG
jgi:hypothetical protein